MTTRNLPTELLRAIVKDTEEHSSILNLRAVSKKLFSIATPVAFRVLVVHDSAQSGDALTSLQGCDPLVTSTVREVVFKGDKEEETMMSQEENREALTIAFSGLAKFPNLHSLRFDFHKRFEEKDPWQMPENPSHFLRLQLQIFGALAAHPPPPLLSLTFNNVIAVPDAIYADADFQKLFSSLQTFEISCICNTYYVEGAYVELPLGEFWENSVPHMLRSATSVTSLIIRTDLTVGAQPALSFQETVFPNLTSLVLNRFAMESYVVAFILEHKTTLARLELCDCSIDGGEDLDYPSPWHDVFSRFEAELLALQEFVFESKETPRNSDDRGERDPRFVYTRLDPGWGYMNVDEADIGEERDLPALESLLNVLEKRRACTQEEVA